MQPESPAYIWSAHEAAQLIRQFIDRKSFADYASDAMLRSAVERQFTIIGEALNRLSKVDSALAQTFPNLPKIVAFRNVLVHGYAVVRDETVWDVAVNGLPELIDHLAVVLSHLDPKH